MIAKFRVLFRRFSGSGDTENPNRKCEPEAHAFLVDTVAEAGAGMRLDGDAGLFQGGLGLG